MKLQGLLLKELEPDVDAEFGQAVCCDILPEYISDVTKMGECYEQIIGSAYDLADIIAQLQLDKFKKHIEGAREEIDRLVAGYGVAMGADTDQFPEYIVTNQIIKVLIGEEE